MYQIPIGSNPIPDPASFGTAFEAERELADQACGLTFV